MPFSRSWVLARNWRESGLGLSSLTLVNPLLSFSAKNNQERLEHKTFTKNPDFSHSVRK
jgi:hypothetical protein